MAKHTNLLWGGTGEGKTALLKTFAKGLWEKEGKKTRLVSAERAQSEGVMREGIDNGWILPWWIDARLDDAGAVVTPFERLTDAMLGKWPEDAENPLSGLVSAFTINYRARCEAGHDPVTIYQSEKPATAPQLICPKCKKPSIQETLRVVCDRRLDEIGAYVIEGLTEFGAIFMRNLEIRAAKGEKTGGDIPVAFTDGHMVIGSPTRGHYGTAQKQLQNRVGESKNLPVDYVWWTAGREDGKDDDRGGLSVFGPKLPGQAATADVPRWFGTTLSACAAAKNGGEQEFRLYLKRYTMDWVAMIKDKTNLVNNRIAPENLQGIPQFVVVDHSKVEVEVAGVKMRPSTLLYEITKLIEGRQSPK